MRFAALILEARICTSVDTQCALCNRQRERNLGMTETYLEDTVDWVCRDCALGIDRELACFAYLPEHLPKPNKRNFQSYEFGVCPECGQPGGFLNIGPDYWCICYRHGFRWCIGYNTMSEWRYESEEEWIANAKLLRRYREVEPHYSPLCLRARLLCTLKNRLRNFSNSSRVDDDDVPF